MPIKEEQKTNKQHAVPQNIMDVEFKIIGDLTMRQFIYLIVFGVSAYLFYQLIPIAIFRWPIVLGLILLGVGLAFVPVGERGLDTWVVSFFNAVYSPTQRIWKKQASLPMAFDYQSIAVVKQELITLAPTSSRRKLEEYLEVQGRQEHKLDALDIPEQDYIRKVREAFAVYEPEPVPTPPAPAAVAVAVEPEVAPTAAPAVTPPPQEPKKLVPVTSKPQSQPPKVPEKKPILQEKPEIVKEAVPLIQKARTQVPRRFASEIPLSPMTPDRHSGRRFVNLTPGQGRLILPIRGERVLQTHAEEKIEQSISDKAKQLKELMVQIKGELPGKAGSPAAEQIKKAALEVKKEIEEEETKLEKQPDEQVKTFVTTLGQPEKRAPVNARSATPGGSGTLTDAPNVISGFVRNAANKGVANVILMVKTQRGEPVRALKTDALGKFITSTPLANGSYALEADSTKKTDLSFDIISVDLTGDVVPPLELIGS